MNPSKLNRHLEKTHSELKSSPLSYFENWRSSFQNQANKLKKYVTVNDKGQIEIYMIAQLIAKKKRPHCEEADIILPALKIAAECMLNNDVVQKFKPIPLTSITIARRI